MIVCFRCGTPPVVIEYDFFPNQRCVCGKLVLSERVEADGSGRDAQTVFHDRAVGFGFVLDGRFGLRFSSIGPEYLQHVEDSEVPDLLRSYAVRLVLDA